MRLVHNQDASGKGFHESGQETPTGELKALEHQIQQFKTQFAQNRPSDQQIIQMPPPQNIREVVKPIHPWIQIPDAFMVEINLGTITETFKTHTAIVKGKLTNQHGILILHTFIKDVERIIELEEKEKTLSGRLNAFVVSDPAYLEVCNGYQATHQELKNQRANNPLEEYTETILEDYWTGQPDTAENRKWQTEFMQNSVKEINRQQKMHSGKDDRNDNKNLAQYDEEPEKTMSSNREGGLKRTLSNLIR